LDVLEFTATHTFSGSFLIVCNSLVARNQILAVSPIPMADTNLSMRPWTHFACASEVVLSQKVVIEIDGILEHACDIDTANKLLARHAWLEHVDLLTSTKADMSNFRLTAWTTDPSIISSMKLLRIAESDISVIHSNRGTQLIFGKLEPNHREKRTMQCPIYFNLRSITDYRPRTPSTFVSSPSDDGDSGPDGNPNRSYGFHQGQGPLISSFSRRLCNDGDSSAGFGCEYTNRARQRMKQMAAVARHFSFVNLD
jgi:hypothetical protein